MAGLSPSEQARSSPIGKIISAFFVQFFDLAGSNVRKNPWFLNQMLHPAKGPQRSSGSFPYSYAASVRYSGM
jgi:hypothetical protein